MRRHARRRGPPAPAPTEGRTVITAIRKAARTTLTAAGCAALLAAGTAGCGTVRQLSAAEKVHSAAERLTDGRTLAGELSLQATPAQLRAFAGLSGDSMGQRDAESFADLRLAFSVSADRPLKDVPALRSGVVAPGTAGLSGDRSVDLSCTLRRRDGGVLVEVRQVDGRMYGRVDLDAFAALVGADPGDMDAMESDIPPELGTFRKALHGEWISLDPALLRRGTDAARRQAGGAPSTGPSPDPAAQRRLLDAVGAVLADDVSFEDKGTEGGADRVVVSAPARTLVRDLQKAVRPLVPGAPGSSGLPGIPGIPGTPGLPGLGDGLPADAAEGIPDRPVSADLLIRDGALASVSVDLARLEPKASWSDHLPLRLTFSRTAPPVQAPPHATPLTAEDLDGMAAFMSDGEDPGSDSGSFDSSGLPDGV
ncbi:hypothetical protein [Streptomyces sp. NPDC001380]|uniref:hypothetical protein n=1 Tax=Streptomyces sp. NPDC001380 TaxID=3364566 RepID=UPI00367F4311